MSVRKCLWCLKEEGKVTFEKKAHIIPKSLKGKLLSENECDICNEFFGTQYPNDKGKKPAIDSVFKEALNVSRFRLLQSMFSDDVIEKREGKFKSYYFSFHRKKGLKLRRTLKLKKNFQRKLCTQFKRGLYKVFLETYHKNTNKGFDLRFNFIRDYVRYEHIYGTNLPVLYFENRVGSTPPFPEDYVINPQIMFWDSEDDDFQKFGFSTFSLLGHTFAIPVNEAYHITYDSYFNNLEKPLTILYKKSLKNIEYFADIDLTLSFLNDKKPVRKRPIIYT